MATLEDAFAEIDKNDRVCPQPIKWNEPWEMLPNKRRKGAGWEPSLPLILATWWNTPILSKKLRLREHLVWASQHGSLDVVYAFLPNLKEEDWYHGNERDL